MIKFPDPAQYLKRHNPFYQEFYRSQITNIEFATQTFFMKFVQYSQVHL